MSYELFLGDCIDVLRKHVESNSIDFILSDIPYGTTACSWDTIIPIRDMWEQINRVRTSTAPVALHCTQPFTSVLILSNLEEFKYCWVWDKGFGRGHLVAKYRPMQQTEEIAIFGGSQYYPIMRNRDKPVLSREAARTEIMGGSSRSHKHAGKILSNKHPTNVLRFKPVLPFKCLHPTEKPVELLKYLIQTYTIENMTVLDLSMGSGSTGEACLATFRKFIGIEIKEEIFTLAKNRIDYYHSSGLRLGKEYRGGKISPEAYPGKLF